MAAGAERTAPRRGARRPGAWKSRFLSVRRSRADFVEEAGPWVKPAIASQTIHDPANHRRPTGARSGGNRRIDGYQRRSSHRGRPTSNPAPRAEASQVGPPERPAKWAVYRVDGISQIQRRRVAGSGQEIRPIFTMGNPTISGSISSLIRIAKSLYRERAASGLKNFKRQAHSRLFWKRRATWPHVEALRVGSLSAPRPPGPPEREVSTLFGQGL